MPLDGSEMLFDEPRLAKLRQVECLLASEDRWCKGRLHDRKGRHCLLGALAEVDGRQDLTRPILRAIKAVSGRHYWRIESFNDNPTTTHRDVLRVLHHTRLLIIADLGGADRPRPWYLKAWETISSTVAISGVETAYPEAEGAVSSAPRAGAAGRGKAARRPQAMRDTVSA
jgi:hypothetical protein